MMQKMFDQNARDLKNQIEGLKKDIEGLNE